MYMCVHVSLAELSGVGLKVSWCLYLFQVVQHPPQFVPGNFVMYAQKEHAQSLLMEPTITALLRQCHQCSYPFQPRRSFFGLHFIT